MYIAKQIEDLAFYRRVRCPVRQDAAGPKGPEWLPMISVLRRDYPIFFHKTLMHPTVNEWIFALLVML